MTNEEIDEILTAYAACKFEHRCAECPMSKIAQYGDCSDILDNKVMEALKRLKYLENPKSSEIPKDEPDPLYIYDIYGATKVGFYVNFPEITDPGFDTKMHTIRSNELEFTISSKTHSFVIFPSLGNTGPLYNILGFNFSKISSVLFNLF